MLEDGLFRRFPRPDFAVALHVAADVPSGKIEYLAGYAQANVDSVDITVKGRGGHGASPDTTIDPIVIAARLVLDLQTIVSREMKPIDPAVITVGSIHGGSKHNIIGDECKLQLTVRSYTPEVREKLLDAIRRKALAAAASSGRTGAGGRSLRRDAGAVQRSGVDGPRREGVRASDRRDERGRGQAVDGRRGFQRVRPGRRADLHVQAGRGRSIAARRVRARKGAAAVAAFAAVLSERGGGAAGRRAGDGCRRGRSVAAQGKAGDAE